MALSSNVQKFGAAAMAALSIGVAANDVSAQAQVQPVLPSQMVLDQCASKESVLSGLRAEQQVPLVVAFARKLTGAGAVLERNVFTSNSSLSRGYHLVENSRGHFCKAANLNSIRIFNGLSNTIDSSAYLGRTGNSPGTLNFAINSGYNDDGEVPMFQAVAEASGNVVTITGQPEPATKGAMIISTSSGAGLDLFELATPRYTPVAMQFIRDNSRIQLGMIN